jgi:hypothetical protein
MVDYLRYSNTETDFGLVYNDINIELITYCEETSSSVKVRPLQLVASRQHAWL